MKRVRAYDRAAEIDGGADFTIRLNYAITLSQRRRRGTVAEQFAEFEKAWLAADEESRAADPDVETQAETLRRALGL